MIHGCHDAISHKVSGFFKSYSLVMIVVLALLIVLLLGGLFLLKCLKTIQNRVKLTLLRRV